MQRARLALAAVVMLLAVSASRASDVPASGIAVQVTAEALKALRHGGYVMVLSHGSDANDEVDRQPVKPSQCATQRSLTDTGRLMASGIGKLLARENVPVGMLLSSRYCRGVETAERIAEQTRPRTVRRLDALNEASAASPSEKERRMRALRRLAGTAPSEGTNTLIVTHRSNMASAFGPEFAKVLDGELAVFLPAASIDARPYRLAYRLKVTDLSAYASTRARPSKAEPS